MGIRPVIMNPLAPVLLGPLLTLGGVARVTTIAITQSSTMVLNLEQTVAGTSDGGAGRTVLIYSEESDGTAIETLGTATTAADGSWSATVTPTTLGGVASGTTVRFRVEADGVGDTVAEAIYQPLTSVSAADVTVVETTIDGDLDGAAWADEQCTTTDIGGGEYEIVEDSSNNVHRAVTATAIADLATGKPATLSILARRGTGTRNLRFYADTGVNGIADVDLGTGAVLNSNYGTVTVTAVGSDWLVELEMPALTNQTVRIMLLSGTTTSYPGDGSSSIIVSSLDIEQRRISVAADQVGSNDLSQVTDTRQFVLETDGQGPYGLESTTGTLFTDATWVASALAGDDVPFSIASLWTHIDTTYGTQTSERLGNQTLSTPGITLYSVISGNHRVVRHDGTSAANTVVGPADGEVDCYCHSFRGVADAETNANGDVATGSGDVGSIAIDQFVIGAVRESGTSRMGPTARWRETILFGEALTSTQQADVVEQLLEKWGFSISITGIAGDAGAGVYTNTPIAVYGSAPGWAGSTLTATIDGVTLGTAVVQEDETFWIDGEVDPTMIPAAGSGNPADVVVSVGGGGLRPNQDTTTVVVTTESVTFQGWADFADEATLTINGSSEVEAATDKSSRGNDFTYAVAGLPWVDGLVNSLAALDCAGATDARRLVTADTDEDGHVFVVARYDGALPFAGFIGLATSVETSKQLFVGNNGTSAWQTLAYITARYVDGVSSDAVDNSLHIYELETNRTNDGLTIGNENASANRGWNGPICEALRFGPAGTSLSAGAAASVRHYLQTKWGTP